MKQFKCWNTLVCKSIVLIIVLIYIDGCTKYFLFCFIFPKTKTNLKTFVFDCLLTSCCFFACCSFEIFFLFFFFRSFRVLKKKKKIARLQMNKTRTACFIADLTFLIRPVFFFLMLS